LYYNSIVIIVILRLEVEGSPPALAFGTSWWRAGRFFASLRM